MHACFVHRRWIVGILVLTSVFVVLRGFATELAGAETAPIVPTFSLVSSTNGATAELAWGLPRNQFQVRFKEPLEEWSDWTPKGASSAVIQSAYLGETVKLRVREVATKLIVWEGKTVVMPRMTCATDEVNDYVPGESAPIDVPRDPTRPSVAISMSHPESSSEIVSSLGSEATIQEVRYEKPLSDGSVYTAGMMADPGGSAKDAIDAFNSFVQEDVLDYGNELASEDGPSSSVLKSVSTSFDDPSSAKISQISLSAPASQLESVMGEIGTAVKSAKLSNTSEACPEYAAPLSAVAPLPFSETDGQDPAYSAQTFTDDTGDDSTEGTSTSVSAKSKPSFTHFTPRSIKVATYNRATRRVHGKVERVRKAVLSWTWCSACTSYWDNMNDRSQWQRSGVEVQLELGQDGDRAFWGRVPWTNPPEINKRHKGGGVAFAWSANFACAYPDDYNSDANGVSSVTVGTYCPPSSSDAPHSWRWTQVLLKRGRKDGHYYYDNHDGVRPSVQPVRWAETTAESAYCALQRGRPGGCEYGVGSVNGVGGLGYGDYWRTDSSRYPSTLITPGRTRFYRENIAKKLVDAAPEQCSGVPDVPTTVYYGTEFRWCGTSANISLASAFSAASCSMISSEWVGDGSGHGRGALSVRTPAGLPSGSDAGLGTALEFFYRGYARQYLSRRFTVSSSDFRTTSDPVGVGDPVFVDCVFLTPKLADHMDGVLEHCLPVILGSESASECATYVESFGGSMEDLQVAGSFLASPSLLPDTAIQLPRDCVGATTHPNPATFVFGFPGKFDASTIGQDCSDPTGGDSGGGPTGSTGGGTGGQTGGGSGEGDDSGSSDAAIADVNEHVSFDWNPDDRALTVTNHSAQTSVGCLAASGGWGDDSNGHPRGASVGYPDSIVQVAPSSDETMTIVGYSGAQDGDVLMVYCLAGSGTDFAAVFDYWLACQLGGDVEACEALANYSLGRDYFYVSSNQFASPENHIHDCGGSDMSGGIPVFAYGETGPYTQAKSGQDCLPPSESP